MDRLQRLAKKKLEIDYTRLRLQLAKDWEDAEEERYWSRRTRLEKAYREAYFSFFSDEEVLEKAKSDLLEFYILYGDRHAKEI
jgi:hypothetical protein